MADFSGSSVGAGFALGALDQFDDLLRVGIVYRSRIQPTVTGTQQVAFSPLIGVASPVIGAALSASAGSASSRFSLPDSLSFGFYKQIDERWSVMADLQWTDWSLIDTLAIIPANHAPATVLPENLAQHVVWRIRRQLSSDHEAAAPGRHRIRSVACHRQQSDDPNSRCQSVLGGRGDHLQSVDQC